jgi:hypothetical protein
MEGGLRRGAYGAERAPATPNRSSVTPEDHRARRSSPLHRAAGRGKERKTPVHFPTVESGFRSKIIFLTVCTNRRRPLLANKEAAERIINAWQTADFWRVGRYVIMPDHIHLFCAPGTLVLTRLKDWISFWRNHVTRAWSVREELPLWQRVLGHPATA